MRSFTAYGMKRKVQQCREIGLCIGIALILSLCGCAQTAEETPVAEMETTADAIEQEEQTTDGSVLQEEQEPEKEIDYDRLNVYIPILEEYERAWEDEDYTIEELQNVAGVFITLTDAKFRLGTKEKDYALYYSMSDLTGDGTEELIIGIRGEDGIAPCFLYTENGERIHMTDSRTWSDLVEKPTILYENGIVESTEYVKYGMYRYNFYQLSSLYSLSEGIGTMDLIDRYFYIEDSENGNRYYKGDIANPITEEEFWNGINDYESMSQIKLDWHELEGFWEPDEEVAGTTVIGEEHRQSEREESEEEAADSKEEEPEDGAGSKEDKSVIFIPKVTHYYPNGSIDYREESEYDGVENRIKMTMYWPDGSVRSWYESEYDSAGNLIRKTGYTADGSIDYRLEYEYDHAGNPVEYISYDADDSIKFWSVDEYDDAGNQTKSTVYNSDGSIYCWWENEYDSVGNQTRRVDYESDGSLYSWWEYQYDSLENQIKWVSYDVDGSLDWWCEYEYDNMGNQTKSIVYDNNGDIYEWHESEHDSAGNSIRESEYHSGAAEVLSSESVYEYEYDDAGNRTKEIKYRSDGSLEHWYEYDSEGNQTKRVLYRFDGSIFEWYEYEYITIIPQ